MKYTYRGQTFFKDLPVGTCFLNICDEQPQMKIYRIASTDGSIYNVVNLDNGHVYDYGGEEIVIPMEDAEIICNVSKKEAAS